MARQTLVVDASVGVKWFSDVGEAYVAQARGLLRDYPRGDLELVAPDLFFHEIANALVHKPAISADQLFEAMTRLCSLNMASFPVNDRRLKEAVQLARSTKITEYDAYYIVAAIETACPLVTANPRHQGRDLGCRVIPIEEWVGEEGRGIRD